MLPTLRMIAKAFVAPAVAFLLLPACFNSAGLQRTYLEKGKTLLPPPPRAVIVIPGFGNTRLYDPVRETFVWGTPKSMVHVDFEDDVDLPLEAGAADRLVPQGFVGSRGPINVAWRLSTALKRFGGYVSTDAPGQPTVYTFGYDWRRSFIENGRQLRKFIDELRERRGSANERFDLVAHSAGGMVVLAYLSTGGESLDEPAKWRGGASEAASRVGRVVLMATPTRGTAEAFRFLARGERLIRRSIEPEQVATFPSIFELLPFDAYATDEAGRPVDLRRAEEWKSRRLSIWRGNEPDAALERRFSELLERSSRFQQALASRPPLVLIDTIAGDCIPTIRQVPVRKDGSLAFYDRELLPHEVSRYSDLFAAGDGSILASSASGDDAHPTYLCTGHFGLASDPDAVRAVLRLLID